MSKYISLWLSGPMQSWGSSSRSDYRPTSNMPTLSGITGMVRAAYGMKKNEGDFSLIKSMDSYCFITNDTSNSILIDYQNVGAGYSKDMKGFRSTSAKGYGKGNNRQTFREYLLNAKFGVVIKVDNSFDSNYLKYPIFPMFLGRKCCIPDDIIFIGEYSSKQEAKDSIFHKSNTLICIASQLQVDEMQHSEVNATITETQDVPLSANIYGTRKIKTSYEKYEDTF